MTAPDNTILDEAKGLIYGDRQEQYGDAYWSFNNIARGWSVILGVEVPPEAVCLCMDWLKTCRLMNQPTHHDSVVDKAGYAGCYEKVLEGRKKREARGEVKTVDTLKFTKVNDVTSAGVPGSYFPVNDGNA